MNKLKPEDYRTAARYIDNTDCGGVYARSITENIQTGDVFTGSGSVLFWHYCGFALVYGECGDEFISDIYDTFLSGKTVLPRRFLLFDRSGSIAERFSANPGISVERRLFFEYPEGRSPDGFPLPDGFELRSITKELLGAINGRITPSFSWSNSDAFVSGGAGHCVTKNGVPAAWAFSAAVSSGEIDIGVETAEEFRGLGLASSAANAMIRHTLSVGKRPVWACHSGNEASHRLALKLGFVQTAECATIKQLVQS